MAKSNQQATLHIKVKHGETIIMGPGKAQLLIAIQSCGSISAAAKEMHMSYKRAWQLVDVMNTHFSLPVVASMTGGQYGGGAQLTPFGEDLLACYQRLQVQAKNAITEEIAFMNVHLR